MKRQTDIDKLDAAVAPLLHQDNVGRWVWHVFNHNDKHAHRTEIVGIGRTNVHLDSHGARPLSLRVDANGDTASGTSNGYSEFCYTEQHRLERAERVELRTRIDQSLRSSASIELLRRIGAVLDEFGYD